MQVEPRRENRVGVEREFIKFTKTSVCEFTDPLDPRDNFFGGRSSITKLAYDFDEGENKRHVDFVNLYLTVHSFVCDLHTNDWCGSGPNNYALFTNDGKPVRSGKGFTLNWPWEITQHIE